MTLPRNLKHIIFNSEPERIDFTSCSAGGSKNRPPRVASQHGTDLLNQFNNSWAQATTPITNATAVAQRDGIYLTIDIADKCEDVITSLDPQNRRTRVCNVQKNNDETDNNTSPPSTQVTIFIPNEERQMWMDKITEYRDAQTSNGKPKHRDLFSSVDTISQALVEALWTDEPNYLPSETKVWCEAWLNVSSKDNANDIKTSFFALCDRLEIAHKPESLSFPNTCVVAVFCDIQDLKILFESTAAIDEFRLLKDTSEFFTSMPVREQQSWLDDLLQRIQVNPTASVCVGILDTGVNYHHPLLQPFITQENCDSLQPTWEVLDHDDHGTGMAGLAAFGNELPQKLQDTSFSEYNHTLASVKLLPPGNDNPPELWGDFTQQAISRLDILEPTKKQIVCLAVTAGPSCGRPSSWSAAIDQIIFGNGENPKLMFISAGNSKTLLPYPKSQIDTPVEDPAQSWNAITVGACTQLTTISTSGLENCQLVAGVNQLSPWSTSSQSWDKTWPFKPDIVMEGGNAYIENGTALNIEDLMPLTTNRILQKGYFCSFCATSAATALAAHLAARIQAEYPQYWPETIRALIIHSAEWPEELKAQFNFTEANRKKAYETLLRISGYGVPDFQRATHCANNALTIIAEKFIQPFEHIGSDYKTKDMHVFEMPWPKELLQALGDEQVTMRITLSYFIEPGPGEKSYRSRYKYASHALNFDINAISEDKDAFMRRINKRMQDEEYKSTGESAAKNWTLGSLLRTHSGSIHSDIWFGSAIELLTSKYIAVYPSIGWWRERHSLKKVNSQTRYSLIVSLETEREVDLYTPIANALAIKQEIPIEIPNNIPR